MFTWAGGLAVFQHGPSGAGLAAGQGVVLAPATTRIAGYEPEVVVVHLVGWSLSAATEVVPQGAGPDHQELAWDGAGVDVHEAAGGG